MRSTGDLGEDLILAIVSSEESFLREVHEVLDSRVQRDQTWDLNYNETTKLSTLGSGGAMYIDH